MGFFDKGHEKESPIGNLRAHIGTFMYFVKVGKSKFKHKGKVGEIFADMDNTQYLFQQATSGTMYDMKKKLDYTLWDAATHKYTEDIQKLKDELLKAVDEGEESGEFAEEKKEKEIKVEGRTDYETRKKQEKSKLEEEKYDHLLNSVQAQTLIQAVEKNYSTEIKNKTENNDEKENITIKDPVDTRRFGTHDLEVYFKQQCVIME